MEDYPQPATYNQPNNRGIRQLLNVAVVVMLLMSAVLIFLTVAGYSTVNLDGIPADAAVRINGQTVTDTTLKMRPGNYEILISSPRIMPYDESLNVGLLQTINYKPTLKQRSADSIASALIGAVSGTSNPPQFGKVQWFDSNTWVAGALSPTGEVFVFRYDNTQKQWTVAYSTASSYPNNTDSLPGEIVSYIQPLIQQEMQNAT